MSDNIDKLYDEYEKSKLPYTTHFPSITFRAGYKARDEEIEMQKRIIDELTLKYGASRRKEEALKYQLNNSKLFHCPHFVTTNNGYVACELKLPTKKEGVVSENRWSLLRCQNVSHMNGLFINNKEKIISLSDVPIVIIRADNLTCLQENQKKLTELQYILDKSPELRRDIKIAKANLEYDIEQEKINSEIKQN